MVRLALPPDNPQAEFIPSSEEYENGWVHRSEYAERAVSHLESEGRVLVRGVGASGKTVLAWLLAVEASRLGRPAYCVDFTRLGESLDGWPNGRVLLGRNFSIALDFSL